MVGVEGPAGAALVSGAGVVGVVVLVVAVCPESGRKQVALSTARQATMQNTGGRDFIV